MIKITFLTSYCAYILNYITINAETFWYFVAHAHTYICIYVRIHVCACATKYIYIYIMQQFSLKYVVFESTLLNLRKPLRNLDLPTLRKIYIYIYVYICI